MDPPVDYNVSQVKPVGWKIRTSVSHGSTKKDRKTKEIPRIEGTIFKMW
jgi:hypothetical protein